MRVVALEAAAFPDLVAGRLSFPELAIEGLVELLGGKALPATAAERERSVSAELRQQVGSRLGRQERDLEARAERRRGKLETRSARLTFKIRRRPSDAGDLQLVRSGRRRGTGRDEGDGVLGVSVE